MIKKLSSADRKTLFEVWDRVWKRDQEHGWSKLTQAERTFYAAWHVESEVNSGGFESYYFNSGGDHAVDAVTALEGIGAKRLARIAKDANERFPKGKPPSDIDKRQSTMNGIGDKVYTLWDDLDKKVFAHPDPTEELLWAYYLKNKTEFK